MVQLVVIHDQLILGRQWVCVEAAVPVAVASHGVGTSEIYVTVVI